MELEKKLVIEKFIPNPSDDTYTLELGNGQSYGEKSSLIFNKETLLKYGITPSSSLVRKKLIVMLGSNGGGSSYDKHTATLFINENELLFEKLEKVECQEMRCFWITPNLHVKGSSIAYFRSFRENDVDTERFRISPTPKSRPFYELRLEVNGEEYEQLKKKHPVRVNIGFKLADY